MRDPLVRRFVLGELIGTGAVGAVYRAVHRATGTAVAVKRARAEAAGSDRERRWAAFAREAQLVGSLSHRNVVRLLDYGLDEAGAPALVMELASGGSPAGRCDTLVAWAALATAVLDGLAHAHARGVVHRDLKPANLLLPEPGAPTSQTLVGDFGVGALLREAAGERAGTPAYMAPEQFVAPWAVGPRADLYGLGMTLYALIAGVPPFVAPSVAHCANLHLSAPRPRLTALGLPAAVDAWWQRLVCVDWRARFPTAAHARASLLDTGALDATLALGPATVPLATMADTTMAPTAMVTAEGVPGAALAALPPTDAAPEAPVSRLEPDWSAAEALPRSDLRPVLGAGLLGVQRPPLQGMAAARSTLWSALRHVMDAARPRAVGLYGPTGAGKTALMRWLAETAYALGGIEALWVDEQALGHTLARFVGSAEPEALARSLAEADVTGQDRRILSGAAREPAPQRGRALARFAAARAAQAPLVVLVDERAPPAFVERLLAALGDAEARLLIVEVEAREPDVRVELAPLDRDGVLAWLAALLPLDPADQARLADAHAGRPAAALEALTRALDEGRLRWRGDRYALVGGAAASAERPQTEVEALIGWVPLALARGRLAEAERAVRELRGVDDAHLRAPILLAQARVARAARRPAEVLDAARELERRAARAKDERLEGEALILLGYAHWHLGDARRALRVARKAVRRLRGSGQEADALRAMVGQAWLHLQEGEPETALTLALEAAAGFEGVDAEGRGRALALAADAQQRLGQAQGGSDLWTRAREAFRDLGDRAAEARCLADEADAALDGGELEAAGRGYAEGASVLAGEGFALRLRCQVGGLLVRLLERGSDTPALDIDKALTELERWLRLGGAAADAYGVLQGQRLCAALARDWPRWDRISAALAGWAERAPQHTRGKAPVCERAAEVALAHGQPARALEALRDALGHYRSGGIEAGAQRVRSRIESIDATAATLDGKDAGRGHSTYFK